MDLGRTLSTSGYALDQQNTGGFIMMAILTPGPSTSWDLDLAQPLTLDYTEATGTTPESASGPVETSSQQAPYLSQQH